MKVQCHGVIDGLITYEIVLGIDNKGTGIELVTEKTLEHLRTGDYLIVVRKDPDKIPFEVGMDRLQRKQVTRRRKRSTVIETLWEYS